MVEHHIIIVTNHQCITSAALAESDQIVGYKHQPILMPQQIYIRLAIFDSSDLIRATESCLIFDYAKLYQPTQVVTLIYSPF